ncbi:MAG TPA: hypothetical protein VGB20_03160 [bacterium]
MKAQHAGLAAGRWRQLALREQMANIGSEVSRALNWKQKGRGDLQRNAAARACELVELSLDSAHSWPRRRELARLREALIDYFYGSNEFGSSDSLWRSYFDHFAYALRKDR